MKFLAVILLFAVFLSIGGLADDDEFLNLLSISPTTDEIVQKANELFETKDKTSAERTHLVRAYLKSLDIHWIDVNLTNQKLDCYEKDQKVKSMLISAGKGKTYSRYQDPSKKMSHNHVGVFKIRLKCHRQWSKLFKVWMYHCSFFYKSHGIHDCRRANMYRLGHPDSHGCIRTPPKQNPYFWIKINDIVFCHQ